MVHLAVLAHYIATPPAEFERCQDSGVSGASQTLHVLPSSAVLAGPEQAQFVSQGLQYQAELDGSRVPKAVGRHALCYHLVLLGLAQCKHRLVNWASTVQA